MLGELELEGGNVPALLAEQERAGAEPVAGEAAERASRLRADDAVDGEPGAFCRSRTALAVPGPVRPSIGP